MPNLRRRTLLLGIGAFAGSAGVFGVSPAGAQPAPDATPDLALLRRTFALAEDARRRGGAPYGALVADAAGTVIAEHGNTSAVDNGDPTQHAELMVSTAAWRALGDEGMNRATLHASTEPCTMCAGAAYWSGIGTVVYGLSNVRLFEFTHDQPGRASFALPCRDVLLHGQRPITVIGPMLEDEAAQAHQGYWH
jgi:tRNA(Arg) A34 adenosine deaminase TadA